jgi:hypothetical protein
MRFAILAVVACGSARSPSTIKRVPVQPTYARIEIPEVVRSARIPHGEPVFLEAELITTERVLPWLGARLATPPALSRSLGKLGKELVAAKARRSTALGEGKRDRAAQLDQVIGRLEASWLAQLDAGAAHLTADGALARALLTRDRVNDRAAEALDADHRETVAALDLVLAQPSEKRLHAVALFLRADALAQTREVDQTRDAVRTWLTVVAQFPDALPVVEASYLRLAELALASGDLAEALAANRWLATHGTTRDRRHTARYRLGKLHDGERDRVAARAAYCPVVDDASTLARESAARIARGFLDSDLEPLRAACAANACPCSLPVFDDLIDGLLQIEDDARAREVIALALARNPDRERATRWWCEQVRIHERAGSPRAEPDRSACEVATPLAPAGNATELIARYAKQSRALERCFEDAMERGQWKPAALRLELVTDGDGRIERTQITRSTFDPETAACLERTAKRHHFVGVARTVIVIPFRFAPP